jgi:5-methylcytosine-specific restriction endonuclease McrA
MPKSTKDRQIARKPQLPSGTTGRRKAEWFGKTPDTRPPLQVQLRVLERQGGKCALSGVKFQPGDKRRCDHKRPLEDGGLNRESNLQIILDDEHEIKTAQENAARGKTKRAAMAHQGLREPPVMQSRNDLKRDKPKREQLPLPTGLTPLQRRMGWTPGESAVGTIKVKTGFAAWTMEQKVEAARKAAATRKTMAKARKER